MAGALDPVRSVKASFSKIYSSHLKDQENASKINRIWTTVFGVLSLALGIAFVVSCSADSTSSTHLVSVNTTQFILDITTNNSFMSNTSNAAREELLVEFEANNAHIPRQYLFGLSGCCRLYPNDSKLCTKAFPTNPDILTTIVSDINAVSHSSVPIDPVALVSPNFASMQKSYCTTSTVYTAIITTCVVWALLATIFVLVFASKSTLHLFVTLPGVLMAVGGAGLSTWCIVIQLGAYELSQNYAAISFGPGSFLLWAWMICVMLLTPLTAMISILVVLAVALLLLWIAFICFICVMACVCAGGGSGSGNRQEDNPWYWSTDNPNGPNFIPHDL